MVRSDGRGGHLRERGYRVTVDHADAGGHVTDSGSTATLVFDDARQAIGWLTARWAGSVIVLLVWAMMIWDRPTDTALGTWWSAASAIAVLGLGVLNIWAYGVSSDAAPRLREAARLGELSWWERDRFALELAVDRLGWAPRPVFWTTWVLMALAALATLAGVPVLVLRWV
jgi:hypothetical protein